MKHDKLLHGTCGALLAAVFLLPTASATAQVATYDLHLQPSKFTLFTDTYNGNQIYIGGFSGIYPVPGKLGSFHIITDRGPTTDFVNAEGMTLKTFAVPQFGPHLLTVRLLPNGKAKIDDVKPLRRPDGGIITGLPTTLPATDVPYDFNAAELASTPASPLPNGPFVQLELLGANYPRIYVVRRP